MHSPDKLSVVQDRSAGSSVLSKEAGKGSQGLLPSKSLMARHNKILEEGSAGDMLDEVLSGDEEIVALDINKVIQPVNTCIGWVTIYSWCFTRRFRWRNSTH